MQTLDAIEARVLGVLIEKAQTTPGQYPLTLNGLTLGCNQKNNREPVMELSEDQALSAIDGLRSKGFVREAMLSGSRVTKYRHIAREALDIPTAALVLLADLLLRGPRPVGELRGHAIRMLPSPGADAELASIESAERLLESLMSRPEPLVARLPTRPGERAPRYAQLLAPGAHPEPAHHAAQPAGAQSSGGGASSSSLAARIEALETEIAALRREVADLRAHLGG